MNVVSSTESVLVFLAKFFLTRKISFFFFFFISTVAGNAFIYCFPFYSAINFCVSACCDTAVLGQVPAERYTAVPVTTLSVLPSCLNVTIKLQASFGTDKNGEVSADDVF